MAKVDLSLPLGCQGIKPYNTYWSTEDEDLIINNAADLVMIENASEIMRTVMMDKDSIELILKTIAAQYSVSYMPSESFFNEFVDDTCVINGEKLRKKAKEYKKELDSRPKNKVCIGIIAIDLGKIGGHYAAIIYNPKFHEVVLFDSMQTDVCGSPHTWQFECIINLIFDDSAKKIKITRTTKFLKDFTKELSLQKTGGFINEDNLPYSLTLDDNVSSEDKAIIMSQSTENQNHFCYMWAIWFIQHYLKGKDVVDSAKDLFKRNIDPLVAIKVYIWQIFNMKLIAEDGGEINLRGLIPKKLQDYFDKHFLSIWTNDPKRSFSISTNFRRYDIPRPKAPANIESCLISSLNPGNLKLVENLATKNILEFCITKKKANAKLDELPKRRRKG